MRERNGFIQPHHLNDTLNVSLRFADGSIGTIAYYAVGAKNLPKERIEVHGGQVSAVLDDFKSLTVYAKGKKRAHKLLTQDKGQKNEVKGFLDAVRNGGPAPIPLDELFTTSLVTFKILESIRTGQSVVID
jgi:polar amino acid transport system substrate-binding protein